MTEFHDTGFGKRFFERQLPDLTRGLEKTAEVLGQGIEIMEKIARELRNKRVGEEGWKIGQEGKFEDEIIFTACLNDGTSYSIGQIVHSSSDVSYFLYVNGKHLPNKSVDSFSKFYEVLEALADESGLD